MPPAATQGYHYQQHYNMQQPYSQGGRAASPNMQYSDRIPSPPQAHYPVGNDYNQPIPQDRVQHPRFLERHHLQPHHSPQPMHSPNSNPYLQQQPQWTPEVQMRPHSRNQPQYIHQPGYTNTPSPHLPQNSWELDAGKLYQQPNGKEAPSANPLNQTAQYEEYHNTQGPPPYQEYAAGPSHLASPYASTHLQPPSRQPSPAHSPYTQPPQQFASFSSSRLPGGKLTKIIAIPATEAAAGSAFLRSYPPVLQNFNIPREQFLSFLDNINRASVSSPPVQILGLAGNIVSMVPLHTAQIVGGAVNTASKIGSRVIAKSHTEMVMGDANKEIFEPRGLKVQVAKLDAVASISRMPIMGPDGKIEKNASILQPFEDENEYRFMTAQQRRIHALSPWIEYLDVEDIPNVAEGSNFLSKMHASASERGRVKGEKSMMKGRAKAQKEYTKGSEKAQKEYEKKMAELDRDQAKAERKRKERSRERELRKVEEKREKAEKEFESRLARSEKERLKEDKEEKGLKKLLFLIVTNADGQIVHL